MDNVIIDEQATVLFLSKVEMSFVKLHVILHVSY
jgi:hypothetical protein